MADLPTVIVGVDVPPPQKLVGIVGKTNVGKSTFFAAATLATVEIENRPFVTLKPNVGVGFVRKRCVHVELGLRSCNPSAGACIEGWRFIPVKLVDVPGLIPGAHRGRGLGNKFLDELRQADALVLIVDAAGATDSDGNPVPPGTGDPVEEVHQMERELDEWIYSVLSRDWDRFVMKVYASGARVEEALARRLSGLSVTRQHVEKALKLSGLEEKPLRSWSRDDLKLFATALRRSKPILIAANKVDIPEAEDNVKRMRKELKGYTIVPTSAAAELALRRAARAGLIRYLPGDHDFQILDESRLTRRQLQALEYIRENVLRKWGSTGVQQAINAVFLDLLEMIVVYPVEDPNRYTDSKGRVLPDAYLVPRGTTARQLAFMIHTDLGRTFLYAIDARTKRRLAEDYVLRDSDVVKVVAAAARRA
jgi:ribosome-binding ATPase YchF (GTP1/OBG family)